MSQTLPLLLVGIGMSYLALTLILSRRKKPVPVGGEEPERFVFVVPALDEARVIGSTVDGLLATCGARGRVLVVDDGSSDDTAAIVRARQATDDRLWLHQRTLPNARLGKGRALNDAYRLVRDHVLGRGEDPTRVVLAVVDADGRLEPDALDHVSPYFRGPRVGAVQLLVRIRNRRRWLARFQDYEFLVFSALTQTAREKLGSVGLGGNGQFTRLAALMEFGDDPWTDCLTEDLDLGVRLAIGGWENRFCGETSVDQQGLTSVRALVRQRTRWAHGHLQCWTLVPAIVRSQMATTTVLDMCYYLLSPAMSLLASVLFTSAGVWFVYLLVTEPSVWFSMYGLVFGLTVYLLSCTPSLFLAVVYWRRSRDMSLLSALILGNLLPAYNYVWYIAMWKAVGRIVTRHTGWAKTARVIEPDIARTQPRPDVAG
jgi:cellulose synthase/poly-beta-1,6-N-acetylglucosamine synthase-like glycosyltransferase